MKTNADILNSIPSEMDLITYFDSLSIFEKRELINELKVCNSFFNKNMRLKTRLVLFSYGCSFFCYFRISENWIMYYLIGINVPLSLFLFRGIQEALFYEKAIRKLERRL
jgi:hypothetical protein